MAWSRPTPTAGWFPNPACPSVGEPRTEDQGPRTTMILGTRRP